MSLPGRDAPCSHEAIEALVRDELSPETAALLKAHADGCPACQKELMWLRVELDLAARRQKGSSDAHRSRALALWPGVEGRIAKEGRRLFRWPLPLVGQAAAACAVFVGLLVAQRAFFHQGTRHGLIAGISGEAKEDKDDAREMAWPVAGPVRLVLDTAAADMDVTAGGEGEIRLVVSGAGVSELKLNPLGERSYGLLFDGQGSLREGHVRLALPKGSTVELRSRSGDVTLSGLDAPATVHTTSGEVHARDVRGAEVSTVSGGIDIAEARGALRLTTVSGGAEIGYATGAEPDLRHRTTSGDLHFAGRCGKGCSVRGDSVSGDMRLALDRDSSFSLRRRTVSGELSDQLGLQATAEGLRYGAGEGLIELSATSGDLLIEHQ